MTTKIRIIRTAKASRIEDYQILDDAFFNTWPEAFAWLKKHQVKLSEDDKKQVESHKSSEIVVCELIESLGTPYSGDVEYRIEVTTSKREETTQYFSSPWF